MGNCLIKKKKNYYCEQLEAELYFLQKENLRSYDFILREIKTIKNTMKELDSNSRIQSSISLSI